MSRSQPEHHNVRSPTMIKDLEIDMVKQITLDYMQVVCIGVTRTLLNAWTKNLLYNFVQKVPELYDLTFLTHNFHCLLHIHEDAKWHGTLEDINDFKYENLLQTLKKCKENNFVTAQLYNRQVEMSLAQL